MNVEDNKRLHEAIEIPSQGTGYLFWDELEKMFDEIVRLVREATRSVYKVSRVAENRSYANSYRSEGFS